MTENRRSATMYLRLKIMVMTSKFQISPHNLLPPPKMVSPKKECSRGPRKESSDVDGENQRIRTRRTSFTLYDTP